MTKMGVNSSKNKTHDNVCHPEKVSREVFYSTKKRCFQHDKNGRK